MQHVTFSVASTARPDWRVGKLARSRRLMGMATIARLAIEKGHVGQAQTSITRESPMATKQSSAGTGKARKSAKLSVKKKTLKDLGPKGNVKGGLRRATIGSSGGFSTGSGI